MLKGKEFWKVSVQSYADGNDNAEYYVFANSASVAEKSALKVAAQEKSPYCKRYVSRVAVVGMIY